MGEIIILLSFSFLACMMGIVFSYLPKSDAEEKLNSEKEISQDVPLIVG
jgi:hypothetical protein